MSKIIKNNTKNEIWQELKKIPFGETRSYSWLACKIGFKNKERYVASLLKENPYLISYPCHRIIKKDGKAGNNVLGKPFKNFLLEWEKSF
jgi:O-6-methylguanine DNA methyltransferase